MAREIVGNELNSIFSAGTYEWDKPLINKLGLRTFRNISSHEKLNLGRVHFGDNDSEYNVDVEVIVKLAPAQFYEFCVIVKPAEGVMGRALKHFKISTGSGSFTEYWKKFEPLFKGMSEGMIVLERI